MQGPSVVDDNLRNVQPAPSMTFLVDDDPSKMVYDDHSTTEKYRKTLPPMIPLL